MPRLGITLGDPGGIGPEVVLKALAAQPEDAFEYLIFGDPAVAHKTNADCHLQLPFGRRFQLEAAGPKLSPSAPSGSPVAAQSALAALQAGAIRAMAGEIAGLVTAPVNKESIIRLGNPFMGQTEYLSDLAGANRTAMMLLGHDERDRWLRVALVTTHVPLREVADRLTKTKIRQTIELASEACRQLGLPRARIAVCGLNPHAGEGGEIGREEIALITPAVEEARQNGYDISGPIAADTLFYYALRGDFDAVVAMYHDQGLAPLKMIGFENGINWTLGLPFVRTSPDHGTAYNIAGLNRANPGSMAAAIHLAKKLVLSEPAKKSEY